MAEHFLSVAQRRKLARAANNAINIPFMGEGREQRIFEKIVDSVDKHIMRIVPTEILELMDDPNPQIEQTVIDALKEHLTPILTAAIPLPFFARPLAAAILNWVLTFLVETIAEQTTLDEKIEASLSGGALAA